ncbi:hypothetical protein LHJ74_20745 [Streptomyces sp. N2-109]|uniref:Uncharacterized protein n=1 Tax=Streptomyces gossypii TaxID=2883101 RepID=A0ABT2JX51_9ACTN|nr:hypothetical protein [Streptomyces gossypii]MCT2592301.1 hypothetical protein [Streptomyces gossypii]
MTVALMWEAKAAEGLGPELLSWCREHALTPPPIRRETYSAPGDRVLVITWWRAAYEADLPELADPPAELTSRPVHRWRFEQVQPKDTH